MTTNVSRGRRYECAGVFDMDVSGYTTWAFRVSDRFGPINPDYYFSEKQDIV